ncbi:MAG: hypothetical protein ACPLRW_08830 [Moorellales bacterium]
MSKRRRRLVPPVEEALYSRLASTEVYLTKALLEVVDARRFLVEAVSGGEPGEDGRVVPAVYHAGPPRFLGLVLPEAPPRIEARWGGWPGLKVYGEVRDYWYRLVKQALDSGLGPEALGAWQPFQEAGAIFAFRLPSPRGWDPDNYAVRFILNALRYEKILVDDTHERLSFAVFGFRGEPPAVAVGIWEDRRMPLYHGCGRAEWRQMMAKLETAKRESKPLEAGLDVQY